VGWDFSCAVMSDGTLRCWGDNDSGLIGTKEQKSLAAPAAVAGVTGVKELSIGRRHMCGKFADGSFKCWGQNTYGQLGDGTTDDKPAPTAVTAPGLVSIEASMNNFTCGHKSDGAVVCWGRNYEGQLGDGTKEKHEKAILTAVTGAKQVSISYDTACAVMSDGTVSCWGKQDKRGQLGRGPSEKEEILKPAPVVGIAGATQVAVGGAHACALLGDGTVKCWGDNTDGECAVDGAAPQPKPVPIAGVVGATALVAGSASTCALLKTGTLMCWGNNFMGELGGGLTNGSSRQAVPVKGLANVKQMGIGRNNPCAVTTAGDVYCWGDNDKGKVGDGTTEPKRIAPVKISL